MAYVIGIDTGGTYTDTVLLDINAMGDFRVLKKAKAFTTKEKLEIGIRNSIKELKISKEEIGKIEKVVLSTTLATNAIVENFDYNVGLIAIGDLPKGILATDKIRVVKGKMNIKGRVLVNLNEEAVKKAVEELIPEVEAIAVTGLASIRNPIQEKQVEKVIANCSNIPVVCGHEIVSELGYLERTNTAILNAGLLPIINNFVNAIISVLKEFDIQVPVFLVKGDGNITEINTIKRAPIETVLSGPAASMIGAMRLTNKDNAIIADMGGTTTDSGLVVNRRIELSPDGAIVGPWKIKIKSAKLYTFGLGGDSEITTENNVYKIGPKRVLPACRGGSSITPTDILHYTGTFTAWDRNKAVTVINKKAVENRQEPQELVVGSECAIIDKLFYENELIQKHPELPVCAIGAPVGIWYTKASESHGFDLLIPQDYDVANAVGAAAAEVREKVEFIIRPGEEGYGYLLHTLHERYAFVDKEMAIVTGVKEAKEVLSNRIKEQKLEIGEIEVVCEDLFEGEDSIIKRNVVIDESDRVMVMDQGKDKYLETKIIVAMGGKMFVDKL